MFKKLALAAVTATSLGLFAVAPASATGLNNITPDPEPVPEPLTVLGSLAVGGGLAIKKFADSKRQ